MSITRQTLRDTCGCAVVVDVRALGVVVLESIDRCRAHSRGRKYKPGDAPHTGGDTSRGAARRQAGHLQRKERAVLDALARLGAGHAENIARRAGLLRLTAGARLTVLSLCDPPLVYDTGKRAPLDSGHPGIIYDITDRGRDILAARSTT